MNLIGTMREYREMLTAYAAHPPSEPKNLAWQFIASLVALDALDAYDVPEGEACAILEALASAWKARP